MEIYVAAWNFKQLIQSKKLLLEDLPELLTQHGFQGIEVMDRQLPLSDSDYLSRFAKRLKRFKCGFILDISSDLTHQNEDDWLRQIDYVRSMIVLAESMGAKKVRILLGGQTLSFQKLYSKLRNKERANSDLLRKNPPTLLKRFLASHIAARLSHKVRRNTNASVGQTANKKERAVLALHEILPEAERLEIAIVIENHWGISSQPENVVEIVERIKSDFLGTCPDFDNFPKNVDMYDGLATLAGHAQHVHAKSRKFTPKGEEQTIDYSRCLAILKESGYRGTIAIEYEGRGDILRGCLKTGNLIMRHWPTS